MNDNRPQRSTWDVIRKRVAPVAFVAALLLLATRTCGTEMATVTLRFDLGAARPEVDQLSVTVHRGDDADSVAYFDRGVGGPAELAWKLDLDPGDYRLRFRVTRRGGEPVTFERRIVAENRAEITLDLERHLKKPPEP